MYTKKNLIVYLLALVFASGSLFAQTSASLNEPVTVKIKKGLSMSKVGGGLDFLEYLQVGIDETLTKLPQNGVNFEVVGHPNKDVTITFADVTLSNATWATANGGTADNLTFVPAVESTGGSSYSGAASVLSGGTVALSAGAGGVGKVYLWVGGDIDVTSTTEQGDYDAQFTLTVAY